MVIITGRNFLVPLNVRGGIGGFVLSVGELGIHVGKCGCDDDCILSSDTCSFLGGYCGEYVCLGDGPKDGGHFEGGEGCSFCDVDFLFLRMLLGESSGLRDGVADLDGMGVEDFETSLVSFLLPGEQLWVKSGGLSNGSLAIGGNSMTISSSTI